MTSGHSKSGNTKVEILLKDRYEQIIHKYEEVRQGLQSEIDREYQSNNSKQNDERISFDQYQEMKQQINYDIAWQTFDEVNKYFDIDKFVDLNCLDLIDA